MRIGNSKLVAVLLIAIALVVLLPLGLFLANRPTIPAVDVPTPNAYETLRQAGSRVRGLPEDYANTSDVGKLRSFVEENSAELDLIQQAMDQEYWLPIDYDAGMQAAIDSIGPVRQAMRLWHGNARIAGLENDKHREAMLYAELFVLSSKSARGGLMVHVLAAAAYEKLALNRLQELASELTDSQKREVATVLESVKRQPRSIDQVLERERVLVKKEHGTWSGTWMLWSTQQLAQPAIQRLRQVDAEVVQLYEEVLDRLTDPGGP